MRPLTGFLTLFLAGLMLVYAVLVLAGPLSVLKKYDLYFAYTENLLDIPNHPLTPEKAFEMGTYICIHLALDQSYIQRIEWYQSYHPIRIQYYLDSFELTRMEWFDGTGRITRTANYHDKKPIKIATYHAQTGTLLNIWENKYLSNRLIHQTWYSGVDLAGSLDLHYSTHGQLLLINGHLPGGTLCFQLEPCSFPACYTLTDLSQDNPNASPTLITQPKDMKAYVFYDTKTIPYHGALPW